MCRVFYLCAGVEPQAANTVEYMQRHDLGLDVDLGGGGGVCGVM